MCDLDNAKGGVKIGNDYYKMVPIIYSTDNDFNKGIAAANRLIFQDKVKFIISHGIVAADYICPIAQPEKVLTFSLTAIWNSGFLDKWTYNYAILGQGTHEVSVAGYLAENNENIRGKGQLAMAFPDNAPGHQTASNVAAPYQRVGCQPTIVYYPADQRDLSSLGTKISSMKPNWFMAGLGKVEDMGLISGAAYDAGYRGHYFHFLTSDIGLLAPVFKPEVLEGYICALAAMEVTPTTTPYAQTLKDAWIAKYGKWDFPDYMTTPMYNALVAAMQKAGSVDVDAVNAALGTPGLEFPVVDGTMRMITRPDMRLDGKAVDGVSDNLLKQIKNKQPVLLAHFTPDKALEYVRKAYPPLPPGATPTVSRSAIKF